MENGRCRMHGGTSPGRPIIHGRYSVKHKQSLQDKMQQFRKDPEAGSLLDELALERALLQDFLEKIGEVIDQKTRGAIVLLISDIRKTVESISRMMNQTALTAAELDIVYMTMSNLVIKYIPDERLTEFWIEFREALGVSDRGRGSLVGTEAGTGERIS